jgi:2-hydroxychromene-2-carboxylate isomerase
MTHYWRGDAEAVARMMGRTYGESAETNVLVGKNQLLLRKMGHYNCATLHYAGEWYWGVDRLHYLVERFDQQGLNRFKEQVPELASLERARHFTLPATKPTRAEALPPLEMFHSFRSPYSYIALSHIFEIADAFGLMLDIRPVLPMVMRGVSLPQSKLMYIVKDANREAKRREVPFGKIADSLGPGSERCIAAFYYAKEDGRERDFLLEAGKAIFADAIDVATDEGMQVVAERAGLFWPELQEAMKDEGWRDKAAANREALTEAGLWGVPAFRIGEEVFWGQDRDWLLARKIEDLCHGGEGIIE